MESLAHMLSISFGFPTHVMDPWMRSIGVNKHFRLIMDSTAQLVGSVAVVPMAHYFGKRSVTTGAITAVSVAPHLRGKKIAKTAMLNAIEEMAKQDFALSTLYPTAPAVYRGIGYANGAARCSISISLSTIPSPACLPFPGLHVRPFVAAQDECGVRKAYQRWAMHQNGPFVREEQAQEEFCGVWDRSFLVPGEPLQRYVVIDECSQEIVGYTTYALCREGLANLWLQVTDQVLCTPAAGHCLLNFYASNKSMASEVRFFGNLQHPFLSILPELKVELGYLVHVRIISVKRALEQRGYPSTLTAEIHLTVSDAIVPENNGSFILRVSKGVGIVEKGGRGDVSLDVSALASLYTGYLSASQLLSDARISHSGDVECIVVLDTLFAGPAPTLTDFF
eukprot:GILK01004187.1.p1 GENE.GILK01004187.1~~GILK01004187.1.p1  ORF type:complete len:423 (-),score=55.97 GILK01004187.1:165-1346(-)